jgi:uncharacterized protein (DUF433 family)
MKDVDHFNDKVAKGMGVPKEFLTGVSAAGASRVDINKQFPQVTYWTIRAITTDRSRLHAY